MGFAAEDAVLIDVSTKDRAIESIKAVFGLDSMEEIEAILSDVGKKREFIDGWKPYSLSPVKFRGCHVTTSGNGCSDILRLGLLPLVDALKENTEIAKFVCGQYGFSVVEGIDGPEFAINGSGLVAALDRDLLTKLTSDNRVNGYLYCPDGVVDQYDKRPEIFENLSESNPASDRNASIQEWGRTRDAYCVWFEVPYLRVYQIEDIGLMKPCTDEEMYDSKEGLIDLMARVARGEQEKAVTICLDEGYVVPAERCKISRFEEMLN